LKHSSMSFRIIIPIISTSREIFPISLFHGKGFVFFL